ncbi:MAG: CDP-6-deoxy-delta-3,4-glucoseen reductase [Gammaproteobacteria bacterium]|jgi:CDP-4-dehydro-6-deoxyglucose reductase|nr:CDP-6-deoxy-delta-3,4-glucoseen reductase [Gammaproteobacteria bacterium]
MSFKVQIRPSGHSFQAEAGESVLAAGLRQGVVLPYGCRAGACGTCMANLRSGRVRYPDGPPKGLGDADAAAGRVLVCQAVPETDLVLEAREIRLPGDIEIKNLPAKVAELSPLTHDIMRLRLKLPPNERLQFLAGQYLEILLKDGRRRGFSIANAPHDDAFIELHVRLVPGGQFTHYVFTEMKPKAVLRIEGPLGSYYLREDSPRPVILVGGGTGFAPLKGMLEHAFHIGFERPLHLFWGVRGRRDLYMQDRIAEWCARHPNFRYTPVLSEPGPEDRWTGETGMVSDAVARRYPDLSGHDLYMSGPPAMIEAARARFLALGLPAAQMFSDAFEFAADTRATATGSA